MPSGDSLPFGWNDPTGNSWRANAGDTGGTSTSQCGSDGSGGSGGSGGGPCVMGGGTGLPPAPEAPYSTYGSCGCLDGEVPVMLYDGTTKKASEVQDGDVLLGFAGGVPKPQVVMNRFEAIEACIRLSHEHGELICSASHQVVARGGRSVTASGMCPDEDCLVDPDGNQVRILSLENVGPRKVYGWSAYPDANFLAGGVLHHNKTTPVVEILTI